MELSGNVLAQHTRGLGSVSHHSATVMPPVLAVRLAVSAAAGANCHSAVCFWTTYQVHGSSSLVVFNDLRKELSFQSLIFFLHKSEHSEYFTNSVAGFK